MKRRKTRGDWYQGQNYIACKLDYCGTVCRYGVEFLSAHKGWAGCHGCGGSTDGSSDFYKGY